MKSILRTTLAVACLLLITICAALILQKIVGRAGVDLTEQRIYTLSQGTRNILGKLDQTVSLKLYYSRTAARKGPEQIRFFNNYYLYVRDLLEEYVSLAGGKLELEVIDPRRYSVEEEEAIQHSIKSFPLSEDEVFFFGLVAQTELGKRKVIEFFEPGRQEFVEYDLSKLISNVVHRDKKKIGVLSSIDVMSNISPYMAQMMQMQGRQPPKSWTIFTHLADKYELAPVPKETDKVEDDIDFLMLVHPKELSEKTLFAVDQYVMKGGKLLVFVDPHCLSDRPPQMPGNQFAGMNHKAASDLNSLLRNWGVEMEPSLITVDRTLAIKTGMGERVQTLLTFLDLNEQCVNPNEVIAAKLHTIRLLFAGALKKTNVEGVKVTPLLETSKYGNTWQPASPFELRMPNPETIRRSVIDGTEPVMLGCIVTGAFKTNFPDGVKIEAAAKEEEKKGETDNETEEKPKIEIIKQAPPETTVLVFADVDMISDLIAYQNSFFGTSQVGDNASVVFNAMDFLSGTEDLITIRSRGRFQRPFIKVDQIEAEVEKASADEVAVINAKISEYENNLRKLGQGADEQNINVVGKKALEQRENIQAEIRRYRKELRRFSAGRREKIEHLKASLQTHNMVWAPAAVLLIAITLATIRTVRARRYAARRT
jgi:ABC-type uncharacterized transport system involved in gliding motility auxiliary subunit